MLTSLNKHLAVLTMALMSFATFLAPLNSTLANKPCDVLLFPDGEAVAYSDLLGIIVQSNLFTLEKLVMLQEAIAGASNLKLSSEERKHILELVDGMEATGTEMMYSSNTIHFWIEHHKNRVREMF